MRLYSFPTSSAAYRTRIALHLKGMAFDTVTVDIYAGDQHRPDYRSKDDAVFDAITDLMSEGRTSRLYRALVRDKKIASYSAGFTGMPGTKYPHLFAFYAVPLPGHANREMADAIHEEIEKIKKEDITDDELKIIASPNDFVGLNIYAPQYYVVAIDRAPGFKVLPFPTSFPHMNVDWLRIGPETAYWVPRLAAKVWNIDTIYISENGTSADDTVHETLLR